MKYGLIFLSIIILAILPQGLIFRDKIPLCLFRYLTGLECPLCGMTRACYSIIHLDLLSAFRYNPASLILPVMLLAESGYDIFPSPLAGKLRKAVIILFLICLAVLFLIRLSMYFMAR
jgi:hypothetical protein